MEIEKDIILYNSDCFDIFPKIEDKSIDLFILDLPYSTKLWGKTTACKWDEVIDLEEMWKHIKRIMKPNALIVFFCNVKFGYCLIHSNPKWFKYDLIYKKSKKVGFLNSNRAPLRQHENIYVFKDKQGTYNPQKTEGKPYIDKRNRTKTNAYGKITENYIVENKGDRHPTSILEYKNPNKTIHRTQKPVELLEWLIKTYSNEEDTIMDFTMGSGTCGIACMNTKRKFIGVEMDKEIFELTKNRFEEHKKKIKK